ncbi:glycosyl transferase family 2 [Stackebrandtia endophytica]|uniref:Glycosyl transferase family 2 n=1 Tax=Stackebrandtia endophytica TaxID=1496996 RepID=A0A543AZ86_9ACTN|nr:glycosyltransferase [Stackebrandtia endophytica]TQL77892.1 glycosyl transferase family 2 [Stackebrandtia endophytica]
MSWTFDRHLDLMAAQDITRAPRRGDGTAMQPWREPDDLPPRRNPARELRAVTRHLERQPSGHRERIANLAATFGPMATDCRVSVLVPCRTEAQQIPRLLERYLDQRGADGTTVPAAGFEVLVLVNRYADEADDGTAAAAERFCGGRVPVRVAEYLHPADERAPITTVRRLLADTALWRAAERPRYLAPLYLLSEDADVHWLDPRQIATVVDTFDADPGLDGLRGQLDHCPWILARHPLLLLSRRSWNFTEALLSRRCARPDRRPDYDFTWNRLNTSGWNTAFTAEVYARIGGYSVERTLDEDMDIGEKISVLRAYRRHGRLVPQVNTIRSIPNRSEGSPRRWLYWAATGTEPYHEADDFDNFLGRPHERAIKDASLSELEDIAAPRTGLDVDRLTEAMQRDLDFLGRRTGAANRDHGLYRKVLALLGFRPGEAEVTDGRLRIRSLTGVTERLNHHARFAEFTVGAFPKTLPTTAVTWRISAVPRGA